MNPHSPPPFPECAAGTESEPEPGGHPVETPPRDRDLRLLETVRERLDLAMQATQTGLWEWNPDTGAVYFSPIWYTMLGWAPNEFPASPESWRRLLHPDDRARAERTVNRAVSDPRQPSFGFEVRMRTKPEGWRWILTRGRVVERGPRGRARRVVGIQSDISERKHGEARDRLRGEILEKLARGMDLPALLDAIVRGVEGELPGTLASILLLDETGRLRLGAAPNLPGFYNAAVDGTAIGEDVGSCGAAAFRGERVVAADLQSHPNWTAHRELAARAGLAACWSQPVFDSKNRVIATFALYHRAPTLPTEQDFATIAFAANLAGIAIERKREERLLRMAMLAMETIGESIYWLDVYGRILYVNPAVERELDYSAGELRRMRVSDIDPNFPPEAWGPDSELVRKGKAGGLRKLQTAHRHRDGRLIPVEIDADIFHYDGRDYSIAICRDISERLEAENALRKSEAKFSALFELMPTPIALSRLEDGLLLEVSRSFAEYFGYTPDEMVGHSPLPGDIGIWIAPGDRERWRGKLQDAGEIIGFETHLRRKDGAVTTALLSGKIVEIDGERCVITGFHDITEKKRYEAHLEHIAHHDILTGLPNRLLLGDRLRQAIAQNRRANTRVAVCYLDLDGFKAVNDRFGHAAGDGLLIETARRLKAAVREGDTVARLGGDEFVILLAGLADEEECAGVLARLLGAVSAPYPIGGAERAVVSASIGVTVFPNDDADPDTLLRHADRAMYSAKQTGKNRYRLFDGRE